MDFFRAGASQEDNATKARGDIAGHDLVLAGLEARCAPHRSAIRVERDWIAGVAAVEDKLHGPARGTCASRQRWHNGCRERHAFSVLCGILVGFHRCPSRAGDEFFRGFIALREAWVAGYTHVKDAVGLVVFIDDYAAVILRDVHGGVQAGADVANLNFGGGNGTLRVGLTSGLVETSALSNSSSTNVDFQVPFFGLYSSLTYGNFFADAQIRGNFLEGSLTDHQNAVFGEKVNGRGFTVSGNIGYNYKLPGDWFIEPSAGVNWSRTFVDPVSVSTINTLTTAIPLLPPVSFPALNFSNVHIQDFDNVTGRASVRVGTTFFPGQLIFQPFATASVFHEFASPISSRVNTLNVAFNSAFVQQTGLFSTARIGTYAQFGLGVTGQIADSGLTGYVRGDYLTGSRFNGWSVVGGARYDFNPERGPVVQGRSADVAGPPYAPPPYNWTGFFLGPRRPVPFGETQTGRLGTPVEGERPNLRDCLPGVAAATTFSWARLLLAARPSGTGRMRGGETPFPVQAIPAVSLLPVQSL
jgi:hypothetical protein